jgi:hypothetical protein
LSSELRRGGSAERRRFDGMRRREPGSEGWFEAPFSTAVRC